MPRRRDYHGRDPGERWPAGSPDDASGDGQGGRFRATGSTGVSNGDWADQASARMARSSSTGERDVQVRRVADMLVDGEAVAMRDPATNEWVTIAAMGPSGVPGTYVIEGIDRSRRHYGENDVILVRTGAGNPSPAQGTDVDELMDAGEGSMADLPRLLELVDELEVYMEWNDETEVLEPGGDRPVTITGAQVDSTQHGDFITLYGLDPRDEGNPDRQAEELGAYRDSWTVRWQPPWDAPDGQNRTPENIRGLQDAMQVEFRYEDWSGNHLWVPVEIEPPSPGGLYRARQRDGSLTLGNYRAGELVSVRVRHLADWELQDREAQNETPPSTAIPQLGTTEEQLRAALRTYAASGDLGAANAVRVALVDHYRRTNRVGAAAAVDTEDWQHGGEGTGREIAGLFIQGRPVRVRNTRGEFDAVVAIEWIDSAQAYRVTTLDDDQVIAWHNAGAMREYQEPLERSAPATGGDGWRAGGTWSLRDIRDHRSRGHEVQIRNTEGEWDAVASIEYVGEGQYRVDVRDDGEIIFDAEELLEIRVPSDTPVSGAESLRHAAPAREDRTRYNTLIYDNAMEFLRAYDTGDPMEMRRAIEGIQREWIGAEQYSFPGMQYDDVMDDLRELVEQAAFIRRNSSWSDPAMDDVIDGIGSLTNLDVYAPGSPHASHPTGWRSQQGLPQRTATAVDPVRELQQEYRAPAGGGLPEGAATLHEMLGKMTSTRLGYGAVPIAPEVAARLERIFAYYDPDSGMTMDLTETTLLSGGRISVGGKVIGSRGNEVGTWSRTMAADGEVHHSYFQLQPHVQGEGLAVRWFEQLLDGYRREGFTNVTVGANIDVGGYTWTRWFDFESPHKARELLLHMQRRTQQPDLYGWGGVTADTAQEVEDLLARIDAGGVVTAREVSRVGWSRRQRIDVPDGYSTSRLSSLPHVSEYDSNTDWLRDLLPRRSDGSPMEMWVGKLFLLGQSWSGILHL